MKGWSVVLMAVIVVGAPGCARKASQLPAAAVDPSAARQAPDRGHAAEDPGTAAERLSIEFMPVFFGYDSHALRADAREALDHNAKLLAAHSTVTITIEGHCDERGTVEYNQALGERRAQAARDYLIAAGVNAARIEVVSFGKERPFAAGNDEGAWAQNRRAHTVTGGSFLP